MRNIRSGAAVVAVVTISLLSFESDALARTATKTQIYSSEVSHGEETVGAALTKGSTQYGVSGKKIVFKYYKKSGGSWELQDKKRATTSGMGLASATFTAVAKGTCKVTAKFPGTDALAPSKDSWVISCATGKKV